MDTDYRDRLNRIEAYTRHSSRFLFGLMPKLGKKGVESHQSLVYDWLDNKGFKFIRTNYNGVLDQLLRYPGLEEIINKIFIGVTEEQFPENTLNTLRNFWNNGIIPKYADIEKLEVKYRGQKSEETPFTWAPFLIIGYLPESKSDKDKYVERWGEFAAVYFMEIEPYKPKDKI